MHTKLLVTAAATVALSAGTAFAQCDERLQNMSAEYGDFFVAGNVGFTEGRMVLRDLRDAAIRLHQQGLDEACERVVEAMDEAVQAYQAAGTTGERVTTTGTATTGTAAGTATTGTTTVPATEGATTTGTAPAGTATTGAMTTPRGMVPVGTDMTPEQVQARVAPVSEISYSLNTEQIQGRDVYNFNLEDVGDFEGMLLSEGQPTHMILSYGGFLNIGSNDVAIPIESVYYDPEWQAFFVPFTEEEIESAPEYEAQDNWDWTTNDQYWTRG